MGNRFSSHSRGHTFGNVYSTQPSAASLRDSTGFLGIPDAPDDRDRQRRSSPEIRPSYEGDLARIDQALRSLRTNSSDYYSAPANPPNTQPFQPQTACNTNVTAYARHLYRLRRQRDELFGNIFGEPAWDMMLDLFIRQNDKSITSISSLCIAASVPQTTALRWVTEMIAAGIFSRERDPFDRRRSYVELSADAYERMAQLLQSMLDTDQSFAQFPHR